MQTDEAGHHRVPVEGKETRAVRDVDLGVGADRGDAAVLDEDGLSADDGPAGPVHHLHAGQRYRRLVDLDELPHCFGKCVGRLRRARECRGENCERGNEEPHGEFLPAVLWTAPPDG